MNFQNVSPRAILNLIHKTSYRMRASKNHCWKKIFFKFTVVNDALFAIKASGPIFLWFFDPCMLIFLMVSNHPSNAAMVTTYRSSLNRPSANKSQPPRYRRSPLSRDQQEQHPAATNSGSSTPCCWFHPKMVPIYLKYYNWKLRILTSDNNAKTTTTTAKW